MPWQPLVLAEGCPPVMSGITREEADWLAQLATGRRVLEIGSAHGASTIAMGLVAREVVAVDPHQQAEHGAVPMSRGWLEVNLRAYHLENQVELIEESSRTALPRMIENGEAFDLVFIDGDHREFAVVADADNARRLARLLVFHDYGNDEEPAVRSVLDAVFPSHEFRREIRGWLLAVWL